MNNAIPFFFYLLGTAFHGWWRREMTKSKRAAALRVFDLSFLYLHLEFAIQGSSSSLWSVRGLTRYKLNWRIEVQICRKVKWDSSIQRYFFFFISICPNWWIEKIIFGFDRTLDSEIFDKLYSIKVQGTTGGKKREFGNWQPFLLFLRFEYSARDYLNPTIDLLNWAEVQKYSDWSCRQICFQYDRWWSNCIVLTRLKEKRVATHRLGRCK